MAVSFFQNLYSNDCVPCSLQSSMTFPQLNASEAAKLTQPVQDEEIKSALFSMQGMKAPKPDGILAIFYQNQWSTIKNNLCKFIRDIKDGYFDIRGINSTLISLIPKVSHPELISQFRPIGLCNVNYKIWSKLLVQRLKPLLANLVGEEQSSFVPNRQIINNVVIVQ